MKNNDIMDIQSFLDLVDTPVKGSVTERSIATTVLRRTFTYLLTLEQNLTCEINHLIPDEKAPHGWRGLTAKDEYYECAKDGYRTGVVLVFRIANQGTPVRAVALIMSADLTEELFGKTSITLNLLRPIKDVAAKPETVTAKVEQVKEDPKVTKVDNTKAGVQPVAPTATKEPVAQTPIVTPSTPAAAAAQAHPAPATAKNTVQNVQPKPAGK